MARIFLVKNAGGRSHLYAPLAHAPWHAPMRADLVVPFCLSAVGDALARVLPRFADGTAAAWWRKVALRTALRFAIGLLLDASHPPSARRRPSCGSSAPITRAGF